MHIALVGDSVLDNGAYVHGGLDVSTHLRLLAPKGTEVTLCAVDGSKTTDIPRQVASIPKDATYVVLSVGGNDALGRTDVLTRKSATAIGVFEYLAAVVEDFEAKYRAAVRALTALGMPVLLCTIYNGNLPSEMVSAARTALAVFNDRIYQVAGELSAPVLDLRRVCTQPSDYVNLIEPSASGGKKIAASILDAWRRPKS